MTYISTKLRERGLKVLIVPEVATIIATGGGLINIHKMTLQQNVRFQVFSVFLLSSEALFERPQSSKPLWI